ncbi:hypothetical protein Taro_000677 [Colocasia esculenta]|uniref:Uncharacterized protein n=1 Tax=Colocasia esculenta TaxID=4460 RepID=A0A843TFN1_COLES|nr:hypothetical protein [Colocasia esculenta]
MARRDHKIQPARRQWTCTKTKETYGGLDKESLAQSGVFPVERWSMPRECVETSVRRASSARRLREAVTVHKTHE